MPDGRVAFKTWHHHYLGVDYQGQVRVHHHIEQGELFVEEVPSGGKYKNFLFTFSSFMGDHLS